MRTYPREEFQRIRLRMAKDLLEAPAVEVGEWQAKEIRDADWVTREIQNAFFEIDLADTALELQRMIEPNMPWAEDHFEERVFGVPFNPPPSAEWWPHKQQDHADFVDEHGKFSHTYPERFWPKMAGGEKAFVGVDKPMVYNNLHYGIRYPYGDLDDLVEQLKKNSMTRQAYLPVWFPEDTGAVEGQRVPCTLGYHFMVRYGQLNCTYLIRSCDFMRHFQDDVYMAARLTQWVARRIGQPPGALAMWMGSLHIFNGDIPIIRYKFKLGAPDG